MKDITIRRQEPEAMQDILHFLGSYSFNSSPPLQDKEAWAELFRERKGVTYMAVYDGEEPVACAAASPMRENVRGHDFPMSGIWGVATRPEARRKGYSKALLTRLLADLREEGFPLSTLYPFRESFYERLGYITFPLTVKVTFATANLYPALKMDLPGEVVMSDLSDRLDDYLAYVCSHRRRIPGMATFDHVSPLRPRRYPSWLALATVAGETVGLMTYTLKGDGPTLFTMHVGRFYYHTPVGRYLLLSWIARHIDQAREAQIWLPPHERPETWLADMQVETSSAERAAMGRVLDVSRLSGMLVGPGAFTFRLRDPVCPWQEGVWRFSNEDGRLEVERVGNADCTLAIQGLSALIYGTVDPGDFPLRDWGDPDPARQTTMRAMFPAQLPYLHEAF